MAGKAYKYLKPEDAHYWQNGRILLSSLERVGSPEDDRRDDLEGSVRRHMSARIANTDAPQSRRDVALLASMGLAFENCVDVTVTDLRHEEQLTGLMILCLGKTDANPYWLSRGFTSVFEILDLEAFAEHIRLNHRHLLGWAIGRPVGYAEREFGARYAHIPPPDPFVKRLKYCGEDEYRLAWIKTELCPDTFSATLFGGMALIRQVA